MNEVQALQIVRALADGVDPESGEVYPPSSPYQKPDGFDSGRSEIELAREHQRTFSSIHARLVKMGKIRE